MTLQRLAKDGPKQAKTVNRGECHEWRPQFSSWSLGIERKTLGLKWMGFVHFLGHVLYGCELAFGGYGRICGRRIVSTSLLCVSYSACTRVV